MIPLLIFPLLVLLQSDSFWTNAPTIITAMGVFITVLVAAVIKLLTFLKTMRDEVKIVKKSIDGLLEQKTLADKALGRIDALDTAAKEKAIGDARELQALKEQHLLHQTPPNTKSDVKEIVKTIEDTAKETHDAVEEVPDKVIEKLPPK